MSNTIDILTVVDCVSLEAAVANKTIQAGTLQSPTFLGSYSQSDTYIYMITANGFVVNDQAQSELTVKADIGDTVRWMITCPGGGTSYNLILTNWVAGSGGNLIETLSLPLNITLYVGSSTQPAKAIPYTDYCYAGMVTGAGTVQYVLSFQLLDENGNSLGYFCWDPFIIISN